MKSKPPAVIISLFIIVILTAGCMRENREMKDLARLGQKYSVRILRDTWGVPHIFGKKDTDAAFGLAYAHAEDDFKTIQLVLTAVNGRLGTVMGKDGAGNDFLVHLIRLWDTINARYETDLSPETRALCEAYADGINYYAALHPAEASDGLYPVNGKHLVAGFVHKMPLMLGVDKVLLDLFSESKKISFSPAESVLRAAFKSNTLADVRFSAGSNALAVSPRRAAEGKTLLDINSHQPWEGPVTWYEAQVHSEEGWNMTGSLFPGSPVVLHGHNEYLGWAHTNNYPDLVDVYRLEINPENPNQYRFDGEWRNLEVRTAPIKVKLFGFIKWTFNEEVLWSVYGPTVRRPHGVYSIRYAGIGDVRQVEQWYRMNRAKNINEWEQAIRLGTLPMYNCTYADREGNILYLYQALLPLRNEGYDWSKYLPGNTSRTLWTKYLPYERLPRVKNPASGFVINCNNTPFRTTTGFENPRPGDYAPSFGIETWMTNRSLRALELLGSDTSITEQEFYTYKFDMSYSKDSSMAKLIKRINVAVRSGDPLVQDALRVLNKWNMSTDPENTGAAIAVLTDYFTIKTDSMASRRIHEIPDAEINAGFIKAAELLKDKFGRIDVPWQKVNRLIRGTVDLGLGGGPDILHDVSGELQKDGRIKGNKGDSYILMVAWDRGGRVQSKTIHQYGSATLDKKSPHYSDQAPLFVKRQLRPVWREEADILSHLEREYRPGEEIKTNK
jgi:penicillin amidase/acyl-homoserine-lactone acylase